MLPLEHTNSQGWYYFLPSAKPSHSDGWNIPDSQKENTSIFDSMRGPSSSQLCVALRVAYVTKKNVWFSACWHCEKWKILGFQRFHLNQLTRGTNLVDTTLSMSTLADPKKTSPQKTYHAETETCATLSIISYHTPLPPKKKSRYARPPKNHTQYIRSSRPSLEPIYEGAFVFFPRSLGFTLTLLWSKSKVYSRSVFLEPAIHEPVEDPFLWTRRLKVEDMEVIMDFLF